jgi:hypothetical protein
VNNYNWYNNDRRFLQDVFKDDWQLVAALLAATSPRIGLKTSWDWTVRIYRDYITGHKIRLSELHKCHRPNVKRALAGKPLQGAKVRAFYAALCGDDNAVVLDTWMLRLFNYYPRHTHNPEGRRYDRLATAFRTVAEHNNIAPAGLQAILWIKYRQQNGHEPISYSIVGDDKNQLTFADLY